MKMILTKAMLFLGGIIFILLSTGVVFKNKIEDVYFFACYLFLFLGYVYLAIHYKKDFFRSFFDKYKIFSLYLISIGWIVYFSAVVALFMLLAFFAKCYFGVDVVNSLQTGEKWTLTVGFWGSLVWQTYKIIKGERSIINKTKSTYFYACSVLMVLAVFIELLPFVDSLFRLVSI